MTIAARILDWKTIKQTNFHRRTAVNHACRLKETNKTIKKR